MIALTKSNKNVLINFLFLLFILLYFTTLSCDSQISFGSVSNATIPNTFKIQLKIISINPQAFNVHSIVNSLRIKHTTDIIKSILLLHNTYRSCTGHCSRQQFSCLYPNCVP